MWISNVAAQTDLIKDLEWRKVVEDWLNLKYKTKTEAMKAHPKALVMIVPLYPGSRYVNTNTGTVVLSSHFAKFNRLLGRSVQRIQDQEVS